MTEETKPPEGETKPTTFTQQDVNWFVAEERRKLQEKYAGHDDLKKAKEELDRLRAEGQSEQEKAIAKARKEAEDGARSDERSKADTRVLKAEVKALAGTRFASPTDALALLDLSGLTVGDDGEVDEAAITKRLDDLLTAKPYLAAGSGTTSTAGSGLGGLGQGNRPPAGKVTGREQGLAEAAKRFGSRGKQNT